MVAVVSNPPANYSTVVVYIVKLKGNFRKYIYIVVKKLYKDVNL